MALKHPLLNYGGYMEEIRTGDTIPSEHIEWLGSSAGSLVIQRMTAVGESIAAGNVVCIGKNAVRKGFGLMTGSTEQDVEATGLTQLACCALSPTLFIRIYQKTSDSQLYAKAFTVNANWTITDGAEATLAAYAIGSSWLVVRRVSATQFMAGWIKNADSTGYLISGTVGALNAITPGAEAQFHGASTGSFDFKMIDALTWLLAYRDQGDSNYGHIVMGTETAGDVVTPDTANDVKWVSAAVDDIAVGILPQVYSGGSVNRFVISYEKSANSMYEILGTWTGTVPSVTNFAEYGAVESVAIYGNDLAVLDGSKWLGAYQLTSGSWRAGLLKPGFLHGIESISYGIKGIYYSQLAGTNGRNFVHPINLNAFLLSLDAVNAGFYQYNLIRWANQGYSFLGGNVHAFDGVHASALSTDRRIFVVYFNDAADGHHGHLIAYDVGLPFGIALDANTGGTNLLICRKGYADVFSGLVGGSRYYAQVDGTLSGVPNGWPILDAISATEAIVEADMESM